MKVVIIIYLIQYTIYYTFEYIIFRCYHHFLNSSDDYKEKNMEDASTKRAVVTGVRVMENKLWWWDYNPKLVDDFHELF